jgi:predicted RNA-binding protein YlqC (UPF0109 family)
MDNTEKALILENIIYSVVKPLVDKPEKVCLNNIFSKVQGTMIFGLSVDRSDLGKVIGRNGRNANAIRIIMNAVATKNQIRALLDIKSNDDLNFNSHDNGAEL